MAAKRRQARFAHIIDVVIAGMVPIASTATVDRHCSISPLPCVHGNFQMRQHQHQPHEMILGQKRLELLAFGIPDSEPEKKEVY